MRKGGLPSWYVPKRPRQEGRQAGSGGCRSVPDPDQPNLQQPDQATSRTCPRHNLQAYDVQGSSMTSHSSMHVHLTLCCVCAHVCMRASILGPAGTAHMSVHVHFQRSYGRWCMLPDVWVKVGDAGGVPLATLHFPHIHRTISEYQADHLDFQVILGAGGWGREKS